MALCICCQPEGSGEELERAADAAGFATWTLPLVSLQADEDGVEALARYFQQDLNEPVGLIFSSKMAARVFVSEPSFTRHSQLEYFAVGPRTADVLKEAGLAVNIIGDNDLKTLHQKIIADRPSDLPLLHICGKLSPELPNVRRFVVYTAEDLFPGRSEAKRLAKILSEHQQVFWMFTNARSAARLKELIDAGVFDKPRGTGVAIGHSTMKEISAVGFERCLIGEKPVISEMISTILRFESA